MNYRKFGKHDFEISILGFGCMRFPVINDDESKINEKETIKMLHYAIDNGVNYLDTAYPYHGGNSEVIVGKALQGGYREKVRLATKLPVWLVKTYDDFNIFLKEQLEKLHTEHVDCYLLHALNKYSWRRMKDLGALDFLTRAIKDGKIKYAGFSFHDDFKTFKEIIDSYDWDFCQIQFNYLDENYQAGISGLKYAASKNIAVIAMEPIRGGKLAKNLPKEVKAIFGKSKIKRSPAEWALRWVWNHPEITLLLSGMSSLDQVVENVKVANDAYPMPLSEKELDIINEVKEIYKKKIKVNCTSCGYCIPCPNNVNIPKIFNLYNTAFMLDMLEESSKNYREFIEQGIDASKCVECGNCESMCPQHLHIMDSLKEVHKVFTTYHSR